MMFKVGDRVKTNVAYEYSHRRSITGSVLKVERNFNSNTVYVTVKYERIDGRPMNQPVNNGEVVLLRNDLQLLKEKK